MTAILDFYMFICQLFEELQEWNSEFKLIIPKYFDKTYFGTISALLYFSKWLYLNFLRSSISEIQNLSLWDLFWPILTYLTYLIHFDLIWPTLTYLTYFDLFDLFWPMGPILTLNWACLVWHLLLQKRGPKAPQRAPQPSTGHRRRGMEHPKLLITK